MQIDSYFPDILGKDADGNDVKLSNYPGKRFIIYFYPKDSTPGCTLEARSLAVAYPTFLQMGYQIIGVSADSGARHKNFIEKNSLPFPLVADTEHELCEKAGVWQLKKLAGRQYMGIVRTTFVCENDGRVTDVIEKVNTRDAASQLFALLDDRYDPNPA